MVRIRVDEVDNYGNGGGDFFSLKNHGDTAKVQFLYESAKDIQPIVIHKVKDQDDKERKVDCLRTYNDPISACPFCEARFKQQVTLVVPVYNIAEDAVQIWERGKTFASKLSSLAGRYSPLHAHVFDIERDGKPKDTNTKYEVYPLDEDPVPLDEIPEIPELANNLIMTLTAEQMVDYIETGRLPKVESRKQEPERPVRRGSPQSTSSRSQSRRIAASSSTDEETI